MRILLAGFGVVGQSVAKLLALEGSQLTERFGLVPRVVGIVDSKSAVVDERGISLRSAIARKKETGTVGSQRLGRSSADVIRHVEADVLVETTPTNFRTGEPGLANLKAAFQSKKSVVTANKGPLAVAFHALLELAHHNSVQLRFSGAVGGGTPLLDFGRLCSKGDRITGMKGILNSTSNFILTRMEKENTSFDQALKVAQAEGYAEADPSLDVDGFDSAVKLVIIVNFLLGQRPTVKDVKIEGIRTISSTDIRKAKAAGKAIRLVASAESSYAVAPVEIDRRDPLCISGPLNAVKYLCEYSGEKVIVGKGAGGMETATSVVRDLIEIRSLLAERERP